MEVTTALERARELVENGWCQMQPAKDAAGRSVFAHSEDAAQFCVSGAVARATWPWENDDGELWEVTQKCFELLALAVREQGWNMSEHTPWQGIIEWNDEPARTKGDVVALYNRALELAA